MWVEEKFETSTIKESRGAKEELLVPGNQIPLQRLLFGERATKYCLIMIHAAIAQEDMHSAHFARNILGVTQYRSGPGADANGDVTC